MWHDLICTSSCDLESVKYCLHFSLMFYMFPQVGDYSISLKAAARNKHFRVHVEGKMFCIGQRRFDTLDDLVEHYKRAPIYTSPRGDKLYLIKPFQKPAKT